VLRKNKSFQTIQSRPLLHWHKLRPSIRNVPRATLQLPQSKPETFVLGTRRQSEQHRTPLTATASVPGRFDQLTQKVRITLPQRH